MPYSMFDPSALTVRPLAEREHDMSSDEIKPLICLEENRDPNLRAVADAVFAARQGGSPVLFMMGAHVIKTGMSRFVIDLMEAGCITHVGFNGACAIHDFELALIGATTESVEKYIAAGQFGLWCETGRMNDIVRDGSADGLGFGEAVGKAICEGEFPYRDVSILAAGYRLGIPVSVHVALGQDIIHEHPNFDAAATGIASYRDFLIFTNAVSQLEGGVFLNVGTAVMGPEVYLKALSMVRNRAHQQGQQVTDFTTAVFDLQPMQGKDVHTTPSKDQPEYYHRFWKTVLVRTVKDGGRSFYVEGDHRQTVSGLWKLLKEGQR